MDIVIIHKVVRAEGMMSAPAARGTDGDRIIAVADGYECYATILISTKNCNRQSTLMGV